MSNRSGFPYAQWDSAFLSDSKVRRLVRLLPEPVDFYAAVGIFAIMVANAWRTASRDDSIEDECEDAPPRLFEALVAARLLDREGHIPVSSFEKWVVPALDKRKADADRKKRNPSESVGVPVIPEGSNEPTVLTNSSSSTNATGERVAGGEGDDLWQLYAGLTKTAARKPSTIDWLLRIEETYGGEKAAAALIEEHKASPNIGTLLSRTNQRLETAAVKAAIANAGDAKSERIQERMAARRAAWERETGQPWFDPRAES